MLKGGEFLFPAGTVSETFTLDDMSDEQRALRQEVADFTRENILNPKNVAEIEKKNFTVSQWLLGELGKLGCLGIDVPDAFGGLGQDMRTAALVNEEFGRMGSFACTLMAHNGIGLWPILYFGSDVLKEQYLPKIVLGKWIAAYSLTESGSGSDAGAAKATAVPAPDGSGYVLNGEKMFVTNGGIAHLFTVYAQVPGAGLTAFAVERAWSGVSVGKEEHKMGIRGSSTTPLALQDVRVPAGNMLGKPGQGLKIALNILNLGRFKLGVGNLGNARECFAMATKYAAERKQFGRSIASFGMVRNMLAGMAVRIAAMEAVVYRTAMFLDHAISEAKDGDADAVLKAIGEYAMECSIAKVYCSEALWWIVDANVQVHGGYGFTEEFAPERFLRDARINRIFEGTNEINRLVIFDTLCRRGLPRGEKQAEIDLRGQIAEARRFAQDSKFLIRNVRNAAAPLVRQAFSPGAPSAAERFSAFERANGAKRAVLLGIGAALKRFGKDIGDRQLVIGAASDGAIGLYALDSVVAAYERHQTPRGLTCLMLLLADLLPGIAENVRELFRESLDGNERDAALAIASFLVPGVTFPRTPLVNDLTA